MRERKRETEGEERGRKQERELTLEDKNKTVGGVT